MWPLLLRIVGPTLWFLAGSKPSNVLPCKFQVDFISLVRSRAQRFCDFMISFPASLSPRCLSLLAAGPKWAGRKRRHGPEPPLKPQPLVQEGLLVGTPLSRSLAGEREGCGNALLSHFLTPPRPNSLPMNTRLTCTKKKNPSSPGISRFWFCLCSGPPYSLISPFISSFFYTFRLSVLYTCLLCLH